MQIGTQINNGGCEGEKREVAAKVMEKTGSLVEKVMTGKVEEEYPEEDLGSDAEMNSDMDNK